MFHNMNPENMEAAEMLKTVIQKFGEIIIPLETDLQEMKKKLEDNTKVTKELEIKFNKMDFKNARRALLEKDSSSNSVSIEIENNLQGNAVSDTNVIETNTGSAIVTNVEESTTSTVDAMKPSTNTLQEIDSAQEIKQSVTFHEMNLKPELLKGIMNMVDLKSPTPVQRLTIVPFINGRNVLAKASSGSGKTTAFCISILQQIDLTSNECQAIIVTCKQSVAVEIQKKMMLLGDFLDNLRCDVVNNTKTSLYEDMPWLKKGSQVIVGTADLLNSAINRKFLIADHVKVLVLDSFEELIYNGDIERINGVLKWLPINVQIISVSTEFLKIVLDTYNTLTHNNYIQISPADELSTFVGIRHYIVYTREYLKADCLINITSTNQTSTRNSNTLLSSVIIFGNTERTAEEIQNKILTLLGKNLSILIRDGMGRSDRLKNIDKFKTGTNRVLITTGDQDVVISNLGRLVLIVNYDFPLNIENYKRRISPYAQHGIECHVINFVSPNDQSNLNVIRKFFDSDFHELFESNLNSFIENRIY